MPNTLPDGYNSYPNGLILGTNDADNEFASDQVVANADGSVLERLEDLNANIGTPAGASVSADIAAVKAVVDTIGTPAGADFATDIAAIQTEVDKIGTPAGADVSTDIAAIKTEVDKIGTPAGADVSTDIAAIKAETANIATIQATTGGIARKTVAFSNTAEDVNLFTVTGTVRLRVIAVCTTVLASTGGCNLTVNAGSTAIIATTASTDIAANEIWHDATPDASEELASVAAEYIVTNGGDVVLDVENAKQVDSGVLEFYCEYKALSANGAVAAA